MAENSKIEWTTHTFNPVRGCVEVSEGCANCYAATMSLRNPALLGTWGRFGTRIAASADMWKQLYRRVGKAKAGRLLDGIEHNGFPKLEGRGV